MKAVITLDQNKPAAVEIEVNGTKRTVYLAIRELTNLINQSVIEDESLYDGNAKPVLISPSLPPNTVKYGALSDETHIIFLNYPNVKADITYHRTKFENTSFPNMIFAFGIRKNRIVKMHLVTYKGNVLRDDTPLFHFPFSNVWDSTKLCYYSHETVKDLVQMQTFFHRWIEEPFNDHLYGGANLANKPLRELFEMYSKAAFDDSILKPLNKDFQQWSNVILQN